MEVWNFDSLELVGGYHTEIIGMPRCLETNQGITVQFDGIGDALVLDTNPLAGLAEFTVEVVFQPFPNGQVEQRFFHMQESGSDRRVLFETRLTEDNQWFLDTFIQLDEENYALFAEHHKHPLGPWYHAAIVVGDGLFRHYVNGMLELETPISYLPLKEGQTSLGVRLNRVCWYKGAIRTVQITPQVLPPTGFLAI